MLPVCLYGALELLPLGADLVLLLRHTAGLRPGFAGGQPVRHAEDLGDSRAVDLVAVRISTKKKHKKTKIST